MPHVDLEREYNNRIRVPDSPAIAARWQAASSVYRGRAARAELDIAYGQHVRHRYDLFHAGEEAGGPLAVYIHGGYWQRGDRKDYSFVAAKLNELGISVALPSYRLSPEANVAEIVEDLRAFIMALWERTRSRPAVAGHSAGGHLTACMLGTDWEAIGAPADLVRAGYALSGVFDVAPLIHTSINEPLRLDLAAAQAVSPILWPPPARGTRMVAAVGGAESAEFQRQSIDLAAAWSKADVTAECVVVPGADHFTIVDELSRATSAMTVRIAELARWAAAL